MSHHQLRRLAINLITSFHNDLDNLPADAAYCHKIYLAQTAGSYHGKREFKKNERRYLCQVKNFYSVVFPNVGHTILAKGVCTTSKPKLRLLKRF